MGIENEYQVVIVRKQLETVRSSEQLVHARDSRHYRQGFFLQSRPAP